MLRSLLSGQELPSLSRRGALGSFGLGALALIASNTSASAGLFTSSTPSIDLDGICPEWIAHQGSNLNGYIAYLQSIKLQRITVRQIIEAHAKQHGSVWNCLPSREMWVQMSPTLKVIDRVALELNQPVTEIVSAYRAPSYNALCPGAKSGSWHQVNVACDVRFPASPYQVTAVTRNLRSRGLFQGGVGSYSGFTHVDTRGQNEDWSG
jgi:hypothetical protein